MTTAELVEQISFLLGIPSNNNVECQQIERAINIAFTELKRYMKTPVDKTVPYATRIDLEKVGINTLNVLYVYSSRPRVGLTLSSIDSGNVFQVAASVNAYSPIGQTSSLNIDPIMNELALGQVRNTLSSDFQWKYDSLNQVVYCSHRDPKPESVTIRYVPNFQDVSEITNPTWLNYLIRLSEAYMKRSLGRTRSKYTIEGSNVTLDGNILLEEANAEIQSIREELSNKRSSLVILN